KIDAECLFFFKRPRVTGRTRIDIGDRGPAAPIGAHDSRAGEDGPCRVDCGGGKIEFLCDRANGWKFAASGKLSAADSLTHGFCQAACAFFCWFETEIRHGIGETY